jgi:DNA-binding response OmpR family regulator
VCQGAPQRARAFLAKLAATALPPHLTGCTMRVLVIEDNNDIAANIGDYLEDRGHMVDFAGDGVTGLHLAVVNDFDVIVLDLTLPGMDGIEVCKKLRGEAHKQTPVLMLTARDALEQKLTGFDSGADDYMTKPFALQELVARLEVLARRGKGPKSRVLKIADLTFNLDTLVVIRAGQSIQLNPIGLKLLQALMEASPSVVTRQDLEQKVWGEELPDSDSLRVHIHGLRAAVDKPFDKLLIHTRHGIGYRMVDPDAIPA